jgi:hypothetical protein
MSSVESRTALLREATNTPDYRKEHRQILKMSILPFDEFSPALVDCFLHHIFFQTMELYANYTGICHIKNFGRQRQNFSHKNDIKCDFDIP